MLTVLVLVAGSAALLATPGAHLYIVAAGLDVVFDTITTLVTLAVTVLAWLRFRERGEPIAAFQSAAFLVLTAANLAALALVAGQVADARPFVSLGSTPAYAFSAARLLAAGLLVAGGRVALAERDARHTTAALLGPLVALLGFAVLVSALAPVLPSLTSSPAGDAGSDPALPFPASTALGALVQLVGAALFLWAAALMRRLYRRNGSAGDGYLVLGLVFAAFAQLHLALYPSSFAGIVTSGDLLRLAFDITLLLAIEAEARMTLRALRDANRTLVRLQSAEAERAALEERTRVSRELHDGLAQDLWLAKLKVGRLATLTGLGPESAGLCRELDAAIDAGLTEARQAVLALRYPTESGAAFSELLTRYVEDFVDRFGLRAEIECDGDLMRLGPRIEAELLRIAQEALNNVRRHADATVVRVRASARDGSVCLTVEDNGRGFDPAALADGGFGIASMRERAAIIGGRLAVDSRPLDGTRVRVELGVPGLCDSAAAAPG